MFESATKEIIFDKTIELISQYGYEGVSIRNIADHAGIKAPSIYNYYTNKEKLLTDIYDYYLKYLYSEDEPEEKRKEVIRTGSVEDIVMILTNLSFSRWEKKVAKRMMVITKIIYMRKYFDERASKIYITHMEKTKKRLQDLLDYGVDIGRFTPVDTEGFAQIFNSLYVDMGVRAFATKNYQPKTLAEEEKVIKWIGDLMRMIIVN